MRFSFSLSYEMLDMLEKLKADQTDKIKWEILDDEVTGNFLVEKGTIFELNITTPCSASGISKHSTARPRPDTREKRRRKKAARKTPLEGKLPLLADSGQPLSWVL